MAGTGVFFSSCILFAVRNDIRPFCTYTHVTWDVIVTVHISGCFQASYGGANIKYFIDGVSWHILCEVSTEIHELESRVFTYICMYTAFRVGVQTPPTWCFSTLSLLPASTRHVDSSRPSVRLSVSLVDSSASPNTHTHTHTHTQTTSAALELHPSCLGPCQFTSPSLVWYALQLTEIPHYQLYINSDIWLQIDKVCVCARALQQSGDCDSCGYLVSIPWHVLYIIVTRFFFSCDCIWLGPRQILCGWSYREAWDGRGM